MPERVPWTSESNTPSSVGSRGVSQVAARPRNLAPKEHGAWGQLGFPLLVALGLRHPGASAWTFAVAAVALFLAHEPLLVLLGQRGARATREAAAPARRRLTLFTTTAAFGGIGGLLVSNAEVRWAVAMVVTLMLAVLLGFLVRRQERSTAGEISIAWTLPAAALPVALSAGVPLGEAIGCWLSFSLAHSAGVFGVRGIITDYRERRARAGWLGLWVTLAGILVLGSQQIVCAAAALTFWIAVAICRATRPTPKSLRRIGWILVGSSAVHAAWLLVAL